MVSCVFDICNFILDMMYGFTVFLSVTLLSILEVFCTIVFFITVFLNNIECNQSWNAVLHDDVIQWKHFPRYWPFVRGIHRSPVNSPHKGQWRETLMFSLIYAWINGWVNNREAGDSRRHRAHYDVIVMSASCFPSSLNIVNNDSVPVCVRFQALSNPISWCGFHWSHAPQAPQSYYFYVYLMLFFVWYRSILLSSISVTSLWTNYEESKGILQRMNNMSAA